MRFALLGNHVDGLALTAAMVASGRHQLLYHAGPADSVFREHLPPGIRQVHDLEEILADPDVELVVVASGPANRAAHLRRAVQSERHVVCVHPSSDTPDAAYEVGMIQQDTRLALVPLLPAASHPAIRRLGEFLSPDRSGANGLGDFLLLEIEFWSVGEVLLEAGGAGRRPCLPGWDVLRALGGEVAELSVLAPAEEIELGTPLLASGRFERGGMFQVSLVPHRPEPRWRLRLVGSTGQVELLFPLGEPGPAFLTWRDAAGEMHEETWDAANSWPALVEQIEAAIAAASLRVEPGGSRPSWQDEVRCLELDDAARRSAHRRRTVLLEYPESSEEVSFKGTMTLVGCGMLWGIILLLILSRWVPWLGWAVGPLLGVFLLLQLLRWIIPPPQSASSSSPSGGHQPKSEIPNPKSEIRIKTFSF